MLTQTPTALWNCIKDPGPLRDLDAWFLSVYGQRLIGEDGKLLFPLCRRLGFRFSRTVIFGLSVCKHGPDSFSVYESRELHEMRRHQEDWAQFIELGEWTKDVPTEAGTYFVRNKEGFQSVRQLVRLPDGRLHDVSGGYVTPGKVTNWAGDWWVPRVPLLRGAK